MKKRSVLLVLSLIIVSFMIVINLDSVLSSITCYGFETNEYNCKTDCSSCYPRIGHQCEQPSYYGAPDTWGCRYIEERKIWRKITVGSTNSCSFDCPDYSVGNDNYIATGCKSSFKCAYNDYRCACTYSSCTAVNGGWSTASSCSASCGPGNYTKTCTNPAPSCHGSECVCPDGASCSGTGSNNVATFLCNLGSCTSISTAYWINSSGLNNAATSMQYTTLTLFVSGTSLNGININYTIYNASTNLPIYKSSHVATNDFNDSIPWEANTSGVYYFNATLESTGAKVKSANVFVYLGTKNVSCGTLPANATANGLQNYTQTYNANHTWGPLISTSYNITSGICYFKCNAGYNWDSTQNKCKLVLVEYCWDYKDSTNCSNYNPSVAANTIQNGKTICGSSQVFGSDTCVAVCSCVWDSVKNNCTSAAINWTVPSQPSKICGSVSPFCRLNFSIDNSGCLNDLDTLTISQTATWVGTGTPVNCSNAVRTFVCPASYKVDFTTNLGIILLVISVILIYFLSSNKFTRR